MPDDDDSQILEEATSTTEQESTEALSDDEAVENKSSINLFRQEEDKYEYKVTSILGFIRSLSIADTLKKVSETDRDKLFEKSHIASKKHLNKKNNFIV